MTKLLIVGSEGFIGSHLAAYFLKAGYDVYGCDLFEPPLRDYHYTKVSRLSPEWSDLFSATRFDFCINSSGSGNVPYSISHPLIDFEANSLDVIRLLDSIRHFNSDCKYIHISSAAVYGNPEILPVSETSSLHPLSPYGWHKLISEQICREYHEIFGINLAIIRPFSVYGNGLRKQLLWDVCKKMREENEINLYGTGKESRDFIHISDLCFLLSCVIENSSFRGNIYNAGNGRQILIGYIAGLLHDYFGSKKPIHFNGSQRPGDPLQWEADIRRIEALGYRPQKSFETGVAEYVGYFKDLISL